MARAPATQEIEALPESDRLEGFPHPRNTKVLYGHETSQRALVDAFASGRMHHGWLITGPEGVGKATLAYRFATFLLADVSERDPFGQSLDIDSDTTASRQVRALSHPGLLLLRRAWDFKAKRLMTSISVDEVRRLRSFLGHSGGETAWRVVLVDQADDLNINAANALLKSLEEPPPRTISCCSRRSRGACCQPSAPAAARSTRRRFRSSRCARPPRRLSRLRSRSIPRIRNGRCSRGSLGAASAAPSRCPRAAASLSMSESSNP